MKIREISDIGKIDFKKQGGLVPVVVQDDTNGQVLMVGYANAEAVEKTLRSGLAWFYSRSRERLWQKGESSGNILRVSAVYADCDSDTLLVKAAPSGPVCHTGTQSCFATAPGDGHFSHQLDTLIQGRKADLPEGSYTTRLFNSGIERIAQKVGEEATETIIAALRQQDGDLLNEAADLLYHLDVLLVERGLSLADVFKILAERHKNAG